MFLGPLFVGNLVYLFGSYALCYQCQPQIYAYSFIFLFNVVGGIKILYQLVGNYVFIQKFLM